MILYHFFGHDIDMIIYSKKNDIGDLPLVDGIIETCITVPIFRKYISVPEGTRSNKRTNNE
jgi:hypothetical protein